MKTEVVVDRASAIINKEPGVDRVFERINVGEGGHVNVVLKKDRKLTSTEFERNLSPTLAAMADARVRLPQVSRMEVQRVTRATSCFSLAARSPSELNTITNGIAKEMETVPGLRAPRVGSNLAQPEITIKPPGKLAADCCRRRPGRSRPDHPYRDPRRDRAEQHELFTKQ